MNFVSCGFTCIFAKTVVNAVRINKEHIHSILNNIIHTCTVYMYNRNILEYAQIEVTNGNSMILDIEGHSIKYMNIFGIFFLF